MFTVLVALTVLLAMSFQYETAFGPVKVMATLRSSSPEPPHAATLSSSTAMPKAERRPGRQSAGNEAR